MVYIGSVTNILIKSQRNRKRVTSLDGVKKKVPFCRREAGPLECDRGLSARLVIQQSSTVIRTIIFKVGCGGWGDGWQTTLANKSKNKYE